MHAVTPQIELDNTFQAGGRIVKWADQIRLKNLLTNRYLDSRGRLVEDRDPTTLLSLIDVGSGGAAQEGIAYNSIMYLLARTLWLGMRPASSDEVLTRFWVDL